MDAHTTHIVARKNTSLSFTSNELMDHFPFAWLPMDPFTAMALSGTLSPSFSTTSTNDTMYNLNPALYASLVPPIRKPATPTTLEVGRQCKEDEDASIRLVHLLITCTSAIETGDYSIAQGNLSEARKILGEIPTSTGIGRVGKHFIDALVQRLFPAYPHAAPPSPSPSTSIDLHNNFYDAGPYLKFAYSTANQAILKAIKGYNHVHIIDFSLMQGLQWPALMDVFSAREGGPPKLRITGIGPNPIGGRDELHEVGIRLAKYAHSVGIDFTFQGVCVDQLDRLCDWMLLKPIKGEAVAINSILQLHRLLVDPDANPVVPAPIDILLKLVIKINPMIFTVVEHEADHNRPPLLERFTNALFHYATMFDSLEAMHRCTSGRDITDSLTEVYLRGEIFDIVCGEGSARTERHELFGHWRERLTYAGLTQVWFDPDEVDTLKDQLIHVTSLSGSGFNILVCDGSLALAWHNRPLYVATAWCVTGGNAASSMVGNICKGTNDSRRKENRNGPME